MKTSIFLQHFACIIRSQSNNIFYNLSHLELPRFDTHPHSINHSSRISPRSPLCVSMALLRDNLSTHVPVSGHGVPHAYPTGTNGDPVLWRNIGKIESRSLCRITVSAFSIGDPLQCVLRGKRPSCSFSGLRPTSGWCPHLPSLDLFGWWCGVTFNPVSRLLRVC